MHAPMFLFFLFCFAYIAVMVKNSAFFERLTKHLDTTRVQGQQNMLKFIISARKVVVHILFSFFSSSTFAAPAPECCQVNKHKLFVLLWPALMVHSSAWCFSLLKQE